MCNENGICRNSTECSKAQNKSLQIEYFHKRISHLKPQIEVADDSHVQPVVLIAFNIIKFDTDLNNLKNVTSLLSQHKWDNTSVEEKPIRRKRHIADVKSPQDEVEEKFFDKEKPGKSSNSVSHKINENKRTGQESGSDENDSKEAFEDTRDKCDHPEYVVFTWIMCLVALATTLKLYYLVKTFLAIIMTTAYALLVLIPFACVCDMPDK